MSEGLGWIELGDMVYGVYGFRVWATLLHGELHLYRISAQEHTLHE